ncbi:MAG: hypothetical protein IPG42_03855 [Betaproteobacteria bacterium]|nr:hypothetical protein [Betaproteobacteria bacterium]
MHKTHQKDYHDVGHQKARKLIEQNPEDPSLQTLSRLVLALESDADFHLADIYQLNFDQFELAIAILKEWRLDSYYAGKMRLFNVALQATGS